MDRNDRDAAIDRWLALDRRFIAILCVLYITRVCVCIRISDLLSTSCFIVIKALENLTFENPAREMSDFSLAL